jgi:CheY-like chemotaxis protein/RNA polymerase subunit RPABC4/transcription elongation factor Spt4
VRMTPALRELVNRNAGEDEMRKAATLAGTKFLLEDAIDKVRAGVTTLDEVLRVIQLEETDIVGCPSCGSFINRDFSTCPYCLHTLRHICEHCGQELHPDWRLCPYCNKKTARQLELEQTGAAPAARKPPAPELSVAPPGRTRPTTSATTTPQPSDIPVVLESGAVVVEGMAKKPLILVVDDDPSIRQILVKTFQQLPIECVVETAGDGVEALEKVETEIPDLIVLDVMMPRMDGFSVCEQLRANVRTAFIPIMMLTANADELSRTRGFLVGTDDYVGKPFSFPELNARVMRLLRRTYGF